MNSLLLVIAQLCMQYSTYNYRLPIECQQKLIKCAQGNNQQFNTNSQMEANLAKCIIEGVHLK